MLTTFSDTRSIRTNGNSCPASPTMRHLGTQATIRSYLTASDRELMLPEGEEGESETTEATSTPPPPQQPHEPHEPHQPHQPHQPHPTVGYPSLDDSTPLQDLHPINNNPNPNHTQTQTLYDTTAPAPAPAPATTTDSSSSNGLSPTAQEMLDFWWTDGPAGISPERVECPNLFDLNMWLDVDGWMHGPVDDGVVRRAA